MPLSPSQCLLFSWCPSLNGYRTPSQDMVVELNRRHRAHCDQHYILKTNARDDRWFVEAPLPPDAWENQRKPQDASNESN